MLYSARELYSLKNLENLESFNIDGNPFQEDELSVLNIVKTALKHVKRLNGKAIRMNEYNILSSATTTGGCHVGSSQSLQNIPDMLRELSTFS